jgi:hypothetical protein
MLCVHYSYPGLALETYALSCAIKDETLAQFNAARRAARIPEATKASHDMVKRQRRTTAAGVRFASTRTNVPETLSQRRVRGMVWVILMKLFAKAVHAVGTLFTSHPIPYDVSGVILAYVNLCDRGNERSLWLATEAFHDLKFTPGADPSLYLTALQTLAQDRSDMGEEFVIRELYRKYTSLCRVRPHLRLTLASMMSTSG